MSMPFILWLQDELQGSCWPAGPSGNPSHWIRTPSYADCPLVALNHFPITTMVNLVVDHSTWWDKRKSCYVRGKERYICDSWVNRTISYNLWYSNHKIILIKRVKGNTCNDQYSQNVNYIYSTGFSIKQIWSHVLLPHNLHLTSIIQNRTEYKNV